MLRELLVSCAHYVLGPFGSDSDLRRHGEKIAARGGKNSKKRAVVAVARKLAVLLHSLWVSGQLEGGRSRRAKAGGDDPDASILERDARLLCMSECASDL